MSNKFKSIMAAVTAAMLLMLSACSQNAADSSPSPTAPARPTQRPDSTMDPAKLENTIPFTIELTDGRTMSGVLYPDVAPITVENFVSLCNEHFYDGLIFHRVIEGFMIQGGGYTEDMTEKETESIKGEFESNGVENDLKHTRGVISMARTSVPDSASSQFFIMHEAAPHLDGEYAAFGQITEGLEVVDEIAGVDTDSSDKPLENIVIKTITINQ